MGVKDPRILKQILEDLSEEIQKFTLIVRDTIKFANYNQRLAQERIQQGLHKAGIIQNQVAEDESTVQANRAEVEEVLSNSYTAVDTAHQTLSQVTNAQNVANSTLLTWENQLELALAWLQRAEARLDMAIHEYEYAQINLQNAITDLDKARARLNYCESSRDSEGKPIDCSGQRSAVSSAQAAVSQAKSRLQKAEIEVRKAREEVEQAKARVNCCERAVDYSTQAVQRAKRAMQYAQDAIVSAERSLEEAKAAERSVNSAENKLIEEKENAENMILAIKQAEQFTNTAQVDYQNAEQLSESTYSYATLGNQEIDDRIDKLIALNRSEPLFSVPGGQTVYSQPLPQSTTLPGAGFISPQQQSTLTSFKKSISEFAQTLDYKTKDMGRYYRIEAQLKDSNLNDCYVSYDIQADNKVKVLYINVPPNWENQGIGKTLYKQLEQSFSKGTIIYFDEIEYKNQQQHQKAQNFWAKMGFKQKSGETGYFKIVSN